MEIRTLVALAATLACAAVAAHATSEVQTAREQQPVPIPPSFDDPGKVVPETLLAIPGALAGDGTALQIELGAAKSDPRGTSLPDLPVESASH